MPEYYDHKEYITNKISGKISESIPRHVEEKLEKMFEDTQIAYKKSMPNNRKNFLSYPYVLYKCLQLIGECDDFLKRFKLLKKDEKIQEMDEVWKNICIILEWKFIPTPYDKHRK